MSSKSSNSPMPSTLPSSVLRSIKILATGRILLGVGVLVAPQPMLGAFGLSLPADLILIARLAGIRDVVLGALLWTARTNDPTPLGRSDVRRALTAGVMVDTADSMATLYALATGNYDLKNTLTFVAGAVPFIGLGIFGLSSL
ncbi:hypothetical protein GGR51DRAFT_253600 [Nemania sp. FL0031]|nr:hypothetical protein GGR51DRAFT_253600 [Nemania sp. FL0031]